MHNAYFYAWTEGKKQGAQRDIDAIGIKDKELVILQVSENLKNKKDIGKIKEYFETVEIFLRKNKNYRPLFKNELEVKHWLAYFVDDAPEVLGKLIDKNIQPFSGERIRKDIANYIKEVVGDSSINWGRIDNPILQFYRPVAVSK